MSCILQSDILAVKMFRAIYGTRAKQYFSISNYIAQFRPQKSKLRFFHMNDTQNAPSLSQAQRLKKLAQEGHFSYDVAFAVMGEEKKDELDKVVIKNDTLRKYFPRSFTPKQMEDTIIKLLEQWQRKQQRQNER